MKHIPDKLYNQITRLLPIACVDLLIFNPANQILMLKRKYPPAQGEWWFPGGRILHGELRKDAAIRKLHEECGLKALSIRELGTFDLIFDLTPKEELKSHGITTVFKIYVENSEVSIDNQSTVYAWKLIDEWMKEVKHEFLSKVIKNTFNQS